MTAKKKPVKKQSAKIPIKLIDGQYKIKQLFRLKPEEAEVLERYGHTNHCKTLNGSLEGLLSSFDAMVGANSIQRDEIFTLKNNLREASEILFDLRSVLFRMQKFKID